MLVLIPLLELFKPGKEPGFQRVLDNLGPELTMRKLRLKGLFKPFEVCGQQGFWGGLDGKVKRGELSTRLRVGQVEVKTA